MANLTTLKKRKTKKTARLYSGAGNIFKSSMKDGSGVAGMLGAAGSAVNTFNSTAQIKDTSELESQIEDRKTYVSNANSNDELLAEQAADTAIGHVNWRDLLPSAGQSAGNIIGGTLSGAASGAGAGPWGLLAGGGAGLIGGIVGLFTARRKAKREANRLNKEREIANYAKASTMTQKAAALDAAMDLDKQRAYAAEGGFLPQQMSTNGTDINNGITSFNNGGSHEENPYEGIPQGIAPDGLPNLVEEGEVKYNNYIYSDRLMIPKELKRKYKLKGNTYAEAMKHAQKESEERPNDPISKRGLDWIASVLMEAQEQERRSRKLEGSNQLQFSKGGHLFNGTDDLNDLYNKYAEEEFIVDQLNNSSDYIYTDDLVVSSPFNYLPPIDAPKTSMIERDNDYEWSSPDMTADQEDYIEKGEEEPMSPHMDVHEEKSLFDKLASKAAANAVWHEFIKNENNKWFTEIINNSVPGVDLSILNKPLWASSEEGEDTPIISTPVSFKLPPVDAPKIPTESRKKSISNKLPSINAPGPINEYPPKTNLDTPKTNNWLAAAPSLINAAGVLYNALAPSTYEDSPLHQELPRPTYVNIKTPNFTRLSYKPMDTNYYANRLASQANAARQAAIQTAGTNAQTARAGILAADYNAQNQLGELYRKAEEYNSEQKQKVASFNNALEQFNAQQRLQAAQINASLDDKWRSDRLKQLTALAQLKAMEEAGRGEALGESISSLGTSLGSLFKDIQARNAAKKAAEKDKQAKQEELNAARQRPASTSTSRKYGGYLSLTNKRKKRR